MTKFKPGDLIGTDEPLGYVVAVNQGLYTIAWLHESHTTVFYQYKLIDQLFYLTTDIFRGAW